MMLACRTSEVASTLLRQRNPAIVALRTFFASSTDHTRLVSEAQVHCISQDGNIQQFVLAADGVDLDTVKKVPQLHLARICLQDGKKIFGAKVVNRTLGDCPHVCGRLLDAALAEANSKDVEAWSTLHGLSDWVLENGTIENVVRDLKKSQIQRLQSIAKNEMPSSSDAMDKEIWERLAVEFANRGFSDESNLYRERGALERIEHQADTSEYANTCSGTMAVFRFS